MRHSFSFRGLATMLVFCAMLCLVLLPLLLFLLPLSLLVLPFLRIHLLRIPLSFSRSPALFTVICRRSGLLRCLFLFLLCLLLARSPRFLLRSLALLVLSRLLAWLLLRLLSRCLLRLLSLRSPCLRPVLLLLLMLLLMLGWCGWGELA